MRVLIRFFAAAHAVIATLFICVVVVVVVLGVLVVLVVIAVKTLWEAVAAHLGASAGAIQSW